MVLAAGVVVIAIVAFDVLRTVLDVAHGGGPVTGRATKSLWNGLVALHRAGLPAGVLSTGGLVVILVTVGSWIVGLAAGWSLVYLADPGALIDATTRAPAATLDRVYFAAGTMFTLSPGDIVAAASRWRLAAAANVGSGLLLLTLSITYAVPVIEAAVRRRAFASNIWMLGATPSQIAGDSLYDLAVTDDQLAHIRRDLSELAHLHLAYPVLHYFHAGHRRAAFGPNLAALYDALVIAEFGLTGTSPFRRRTYARTRHAIEAFIDPFLLNQPRHDRDPPELPDLTGLAADTTTTVEPAAFSVAVTSLAPIRRKLEALVQEEGWSWSNVIEHDAADAANEPQPIR